MNYIVFDLEWNQPRVRARAVRRGDVVMADEIIQIGAIKLNGQCEVVDEFKYMIKPKYYKKMHSKVKSLTGITELDLKKGEDFEIVIANFQRWCGNDAVFITWGFDDIPVLRTNLKFYNMEYDWLENWYNLQIIYSRQVEEDNEQRALSKAAEHFNIESERAFHDALNDAYYTARICARLDMKKGIEGYKKPFISAKNAKIAPSYVEFEQTSRHMQFNCYKDRASVMCDGRVTASYCPICGSKMEKITKWINQYEGKKISVVACPNHGEFIVGLKFLRNADKTIRVNKTITENSDARKKYEEIRKKHIKNKDKNFLRVH